MSVDDQMRADLGYRMLQQGEFREGWPYYEYRLPRLHSPILKAGLQEWRGEPLEDRALLIYGDQGLGDEIMFARFVPMLRARHPRARITLAVLEPNVNLLSQLDPEIVVMNRLGMAVLPRPDVFVCLCSLPYRLGVTSEAEIDPTPYLTPRWRGGTAVGVAWRGNPVHANDKLRSMPFPQPLMSLPGARLLEPQGDMLDSAVTLSGLRAVVTVDTSWAHLAGAIGVPCFVLVARHSDWRWGLNRRDSYWYETVTVLRQEVWGDWSAPVAAAREALTGRAFASG